MASKGLPSKASEFPDALRPESVRGILADLQRTAASSQIKFSELRSDADRKNSTIVLACQELMEILSPQALGIELSRTQEHIVRKAVCTAISAEPLSTEKTGYHTDCNKLLGIATYLETFVLRRAQEQAKTASSETIAKQAGSVAVSVRRAAQ